MSPLLSEALASILRSVLKVAAGYLVARGVWTADEATNYVAAVALVIIGLGWSYWTTRRSRIKFLTALEAPPGTTEATVDRKVSAGTGATLAVLLACGLAVSVASCAGKARAIAVQADATVYTLLTSVQAGADALETQGRISHDTRLALAPHLLKALKLADNFNRAVRAGVSFTGLAELWQALQTLKVQLSSLLPAGLGGDLIAQVERAIGLVPAPAGGRL